jgi:uncharacterized protein (DUF2235 family)
MKRIVLLCDGTWNSTDAPDPTNVVRTAHALAPTGADGQAQVAVYVEGVGTGRRGVNGVTRAIDRVLGGALGLGLMENVVEAYRHLVFLFEPGDEVFVFGFSRGAFTARSLAGFIRYTGLIAREQLDKLPEAVRRYERRQRGPNGQRLNAEWRAIHAPWTMTDPDDADVYAEFGLREAIPFDIAYLGVWDTVGALGIPGVLTAWPLVGQRHAFHDTELSPMVRMARHAVAIDEPRTPFRPTLWTNLDALNAGRPDHPYRQAWFAGDHGSVGGGGDVRALSSGALLWVLEGAMVAGLEFDPIVLEAIRAEVDPMGPLVNQSDPDRGPLTDLMRRFGRGRDPVGRFADVHPLARERWAFRAEGFAPYRPRPLLGLARELDAWAEARAAPEEASCEAVT